MVAKRHYKEERTLVIIKPDSIQRSLIGEIISRFERIGLKLIGLKFTVATAKQVEEHYTLDPEWRLVTGEKNISAYKAKGLKHPYEGDPYKVTDFILKKLIKYFTSGPVILSVWQGAHAVAVVRKLVGGTEPLTSDVGTIRGDFVLDSYEMADGDGRAVRNLVHASGSVKEAEAEIKHWFKRAELVSYKHLSESILYDINLDGILE
ncbi:MAG: nucleoside-diphosphate kinase [Candidatus Taylorbacteria bacterium]|nr:nucleoside-diphosphate kinase [Candidatus Taylorbacteria bacterium]